VTFVVEKFFSDFCSPKSDCGPGKNFSDSKTFLKTFVPEKFSVIQKNILATFVPEKCFVVREKILATFVPEKFSVVQKKFGKLFSDFCSRKMLAWPNHHL